MAMFKHVAGVGNVPMTPKEIASRQAEQSQPEPAAQPEKTAVEKLTQFLSSNPDVAALIGVTE